MTIADVLLFGNLRFLMMFHFPEKLRTSFIPSTTKWFEKIMNSPEAINAYGRTVLCKTPQKAFTGELKRFPVPAQTKKVDVPEETPKETPKETSKETEKPKETKEKKNQKDR